MEVIHAGGLGLGDGGGGGEGERKLSQKGNMMFYHFFKTFMGVVCKLIDIRHNLMRESCIIASNL